MTKAESIPKVIHYCWFGGAKLGPDELKCLDSWKRYLPNYEIIRWDESNFDVTCCPFVEEAYRAKRWAFVSDYARFKILFDRGGLYFDTDVEVVKPLDDIVAEGPFMGFQTDFTGERCKGEVAPGLGLGAVAGMSIYREALEMYEREHFTLPDGSHDVTTVVQRTTELLRAHGLQDHPGIQKVAGLTLYPSEFFNPKDLWSGVISVTENTRSIHHFGMSWVRPSIRTQQRYTERLMALGLKYGPARGIATAAALVRHLDIRRLINHMRGLEERD